MKPLHNLGRVMTRDGGELALYQRGEDFQIRINGWQLMSSRAHGSEEAMARLACVALNGNAAPRVLIGGLGMGFTLRAALDLLPARSTVVVAEVFSAVVAWNRGPLRHLAKEPLADPRVTVRECDVAALLDPEAFDAILLDVDNGPEALTLASNASLYSAAGLAQIRRALGAGGVVAVWSAGPEPRFAARLHRSGFAVQSVEVPARDANPRIRHTLYLGQRSAALSRRRSGPGGSMPGGATRSSRG